MRRPLPLPVDAATLGESCSEPPPALLVQGIEEFNRGEYYACHETLELLWRAEQRPIRRLYQGILLVGVSLYKVFAQRNYGGAVGLLERGLKHLEGFPPACHTVDVHSLVSDARRYHTSLIQLGEDSFQDLKPDIVPRIRWVDDRAG